MTCSCHGGQTGTVISVKDYSVRLIIDGDAGIWNVEKEKIVKIAPQCLMQEIKS